MRVVNGASLDELHMVLGGSKCREIAMVERKDGA